MLQFQTKVSLATYSVSIREKYTDAPLVFGSFDKVHGLGDVVYGYLATLKKTHARDAEVQSLQRTTALSHDKKASWGVITSGQYGVSADLIDVNTSKLAYQRLPEHAELMPFYFLINLPPAAKYGILILQRHGNQGIVTAFLRGLRGYLAQAYENYVLEVAAHVPSEVIGSLADGELKEMELIYYDIPDDIANKFGLKGNARKHAYLCQSIKAKRRMSLGKPPWMKAILSSKKPLFEVKPDWASDLNEHEEARFKVTYNGTQRTVTMSKMNQLAPYIDITDDVKIGKNGHPVFESVHAIASHLLADIAADMGSGT